MHHALLFSLPDFIMAQFEAHKDAIVFVVIGMVSGLLAQLILPGRGFGILGTIGIGIVGAFGGKFTRHYYTFISDDLFRMIIASTVCCMLISVVINLIRGGEDKDLTHWRDR